MTKRQKTQIVVRCSRGIANEMCRYDGAEIVNELLLEDKWDKVVDRWVSEGNITPAEAELEKERHRLYQFTIEGLHHTTGRWASFGVIVQI